MRAAREADVDLRASSRPQRAKTLLDAGAGSQQEYDQAADAQKAAEAQLKAVDEQIRQQQTELGYYRVTAPTAGVVGDIPVREGDRVTKSTMLTTIDDNAGLEVYINVPVQQAPQLKLGLPVRLLDDTGRSLATEKINFISPSVDDATQTVLAKAARAATAARSAPISSCARASSGRTAPGLTVPLVAVDAHQRPVLRVRRRDRAERRRSWRTSAPVTLGAGRRQRLRRARRPQGRRQADRLGHAEDWRRRAGAGAALAPAAAPARAGAGRGGD